MVTSATKLICLFIILSLAGQSMANNAHVVVGDALGWSPGVESWALGRIFDSGDILHFAYEAGLHTVTEVDSFGFSICKRTDNLFDDNSGLTSYFLTRPGPYYFISTSGTDCLEGLRMVVNVDAWRK